MQSRYNFVRLVSEHNQSSAEWKTSLFSVIIHVALFGKYRNLYKVNKYNTKFSISLMKSGIIFSHHRNFSDEKFLGSRLTALSKPFLSSSVYYIIYLSL
jgi:hypothetical protein